MTLSVTPGQNPPPPALQHLHVIFCDFLPALDFGDKAIQTPRHCPGGAQRDFVLEDIEHGKDEERHGADPRPGGGGEDPGDQLLALPEGILGAARRLAFVPRVPRPAEQGLDGGNDGRTLRGARCC